MGFVSGDSLLDVQYGVIFDPSNIDRFEQERKLVGRVGFGAVAAHFGRIPQLTDEQIEEFAKKLDENNGRV